MQDLRRQSLGQAFSGTVAELVESLAGVNAQTRRGPLAGLWTRMAELDLDELDRQLRKYQLVKANLMRGTVHLVTRRQYTAWRNALQPMLERTVRGFCPRLWERVDHDALLVAASDLLRSHDGLTRTEIGTELAMTFPYPVPSELGFAVRLLLPVVQVADDHAWRPGRTRYLLAEQVFADPLGDPADGLADLMHGYLRAFGPASSADAGYWSGLTRLPPVLDTVGVAVGVPAGGRRWDVEPAVDETPRPTYVLPEFDNVYFCSKDATSPLVSAKKRLISPPGQMPGSLVTDGEVVGDWSWNAKQATVSLNPWRDLTDAEADEFERFRSWVGDAEQAT
jgi:hypothetical protein